MRFPIMNTAYDRQLFIEAPTPHAAFKRYFEQERSLDSANFTNAYLAEIVINHFTSYMARFDGAFLDLTTFRSCSLERAAFRNASLVDAVLDGGNFYRATFDESDLRGVKLVNTPSLAGVTFRKCVFDASFDYNYAHGQGARFEQCTGLVIPPREWEVDGI